MQNAIFAQEASFTMDVSLWKAEIKAHFNRGVFHASEHQRIRKYLLASNLHDSSSLDIFTIYAFGMMSPVSWFYRNLFRNLIR